MFALNPPHRPLFDVMVTNNSFFNSLFSEYTPPSDTSKVELRFTNSSVSLLVRSHLCNVHLVLF